MLAAAENTIGRGRKKQPDWFRESADTLDALIEAKNNAHNRMWQNNSLANRREFRRHQRRVKVAVDTAKESYICRVACEAEKAAKDGRTRLECIRKLQGAHRGCRPLRPVPVLKEDGEPTSGPAEVTSRWYRHFMRTLNDTSEYRDEVIDGMPQLPVRWDLDSPPTAEELDTALAKLRGPGGKAGGRSGILPEMRRNRVVGQDA